MMKRCASILLVGLVLVGLPATFGVWSVVDAEQLRPPKQQKPVARPLKSRVNVGEYLQWPREVAASPTQKEQFELLKQEWLPQLEALHLRLDAIYTNERRQAENAALKAAK